MSLIDGLSSGLGLSRSDSMCRRSSLHLHERMWLGKVKLPSCNFCFLCKSENEPHQSDEKESTSRE